MHSDDDTTHGSFEEKEQKVAFETEEIFQVTFQVFNPPTNTICFLYFILEVLLPCLCFKPQ